MEEEKAVLVRYAGWGALAQCFDNWRLDPITQRMNRDWQTVIAAELRQLLTDEEYESARATTPNAHFTSPVVIEAIWKGMERLGLKEGAEVLEPSMGVGHFFGLQPEHQQPTHRTGVELDSITARIAKKLYPDARVLHKGFEETQLPDDYFDVVVGNVPFGDYGVHDPSMPRRLRSSIHDYFFAKSLEKVRPGGVMALITSHYTMDKKDDVIRRHLVDKADLIGAIRLPNTAFKGNAGTEVVTDILFLRKREEGTEPTGEQWAETGTTWVDGHEITLNEYYIRHPEMMLGEMKLIRGMYRADEPTLVGELTPGKLQEALKALPEGVYLPRYQGRRAPAHGLLIATPERFIGVKDGAYAIVDGQIVIRRGDSFEQVHMTAAAAGRVRGMMQVRDAVREVLRTQLDDAPEPEIVRARQELNRVYDGFVKRHGYLSIRENFRAYAGDPDLPLLLSLENFDPETKAATKTAIFTQRTLERYKPVESVETAIEALTVSLNETGRIDWQRMGELTGFTDAEMQAELSGQVYRNPEGGQWETADEYLSGDVRAKLRAATAAAAINPAYQPNVEALKSVQPPDIPPGDISARLGAAWIPKEDVQRFICELLQVPAHDVTVAHAEAIATWSVRLDYFADRTVANTTTYGTKRVHASDLIEDALNLRTPTVYDTLTDGTRVVNQEETIAAREAQQKIRDRFAIWVWEDPERAERLARIYNDRFNNIRLRTFNGSHLTLPGMNRIGLRNNDLDPHQKSAVWRILQSRSALIGHVVGAGKTATIAATCMEQKRLGLRKKPMIVVPNHLVEQWGAAFLQLYPQANIFVAGKEHFTAGNREKAMARIATGNYDAVIISQKSFEALPVSDATFNHFMRKQLASLEDALLEARAEKGDNRSIVKQLEKAKMRLETKIADRLKREHKDDGVTWEQLGIDQIFVDEADMYKNLGFTTKMNRIAGLSNTESNRAMDMYMKTRYLAERGGGIVFATGTPISNTMAEMYTLMRYLAPQMLQAAGLEHFDAWAANFCEPVTALELAPDGSGYRMNTRMAKFVNLPELLSMFRSFADIQTAEMLHLPRPAIEGGKPKVVVSPASSELKDYVERLVVRAQQLRQVDPRVDNMLKITGDGRKAALDMRLVNATAEPGPGSKVYMAVDNIYHVWKETAAQRSTQLVFCDLSTPTGDGFNIYAEIRARLIERGIPAKEIAFIHDADTDAKKKELFDAVNAGRIRVLLGSTEKMGAGTNVQQKLIAVHHLDAPWRPRDIEQRDGRILRQGNENKQVQIYRYVTEGSFDAYMWQLLETKARFIGQVTSGDVTVREAEDLESGALSFAEIKALASGNPLVLEKVEIDTEMRRLDALRAAHINQQIEIGKQMRILPSRVEQSREYHAGLLVDIAMRDRHNTPEFAMTIGGQVITGKRAREAAGKAILQEIAAAHDGRGGAITIGSYRGFAISTTCGKKSAPRLYLRGRNSYEISVNMGNPLGTIASIDYALRRLDHSAEVELAAIKRMEKELADYQVQHGRIFEHEEQWQAMQEKQRQINQRLELGKDEAQVVAEPEQAGRKEEIERDSAVPSPANAQVGLPGTRTTKPEEERGITDQTRAAFASPIFFEGLFACQVGGGRINRIVISQSPEDAMSFYQFLSGEYGLYICIPCAPEELSSAQSRKVREALMDLRTRVVTATNGNPTGEKIAVFISSIRQDAVRVRPARPDRRDLQYECWTDVLTERRKPPLRQLPAVGKQAPESAHEVTPSVTPMNWGGRGRSAIPPSDPTV
ncbi:DEAD/DEAH box helicase family protein [Thermogemmatispora carboxidivorans]|uniref:DEAD/DEAH box helicase family protein n=1 Tax=Thermogemmatispora carboxidivorans TaxID=1382306 RepID=UPI000699265D|nr:DEAD/DEAH box helicase family protein [Thermogemmatispora carboxidivorans]